MMVSSARNHPDKVLTSTAGATFTPGPWVCYADLPSVEPNWHIITNASRMRVLANVHIEPGNEVDATNARLMTAAPDLYEALRSLLHAFPGDYVNPPLHIIMARDALAKAEAR